MSCESIRGREKKAVGGFLYIFDRKSADAVTTFWRCERKSDGCKARLHVLGDGTFTRMNRHVHKPNPCRVEAVRAITAMKRRAKDTDEGTSVIINTVTQDISEASHGALPKVSTIKKQIRRVRQREGKAPSVPKSLTELFIPQRFSTYESSPGVQENFLLYDSGAHKERVLIFGRPRSIQILKECTVWHGDGTFEVTPPLFYQVFVVHGHRFGAAHPFLYALLPNKTRKTYRALLEGIKILDPSNSLAPTTFMCDFEMALIKEIQNAFPSASIGGCLFHFSQNVQKRVRECGLEKEYEEDATINLHVRMIIALAYLPLRDVVAGFEELEDYVNESLRPVLDYVEDNYIGRRTREGRRRPLFPHEWWNVYERTLRGDARTNNAVEGSHNRFKTELGYSHPTLWKFINKLQQSQKGGDLRYNEGERGIQPYKKRQYKVHDSSILHIVQDRDKRTTIEYLRALAHHC